MPKCELCGEKSDRRTKKLISKQIKMLCRHCYKQLCDGDHLDTIRIMSQHRIYGEKMHNEVIRLSSFFNSNEKSKYEKYPYSNPWSAVPPIHVLKNARKALDTQKSYVGFPETLGDYYGIVAPPYAVNEQKVPEGAIACYYPSTNRVYSKGAINEHTAFHEMYHALERYKVVPKTVDSEKNANFYADACCDLLNQKP